MKNRIYFLMFLLLTSTVALSNDGFNSSDRVLELEMRRLEEKRIDKVLQNELKKQKIKKEVPEKVMVFQSGMKFYIRKITLLNAELLPSKDKMKIIKKYVNNEMGLQEVHNLIRDLTNAYIKKGYIAARVTIPVGQNVNNGELILQIYEGKIENIEINDGTLKDRIKVKGNLTFKEGEVVDMKKLEYVEEVINGIPKSEGSFRLEPGEEIGETKIIGSFKKRKFGKTSIDYNNLGSDDSNGRDSIRISYRHGDIVGFSDTLYIQGSSTIKDDAERYNKSGLIDYNVPFGYWTTGFSYNFSKTKNTIHGVVEDTLNEGTTKNIKFKLNKTLYNGSEGLIKALSNLTFKESDNYIEKSWVEANSYKSSQLDIGLSYTGMLYGGSIFGKLTYYHGLRILGADEDHEEIEAKRQLKKFKFYGRWYKPLKLMNNSLAYELSFDSQYSLDNLYSSDKFYIGDDTTVRGFTNGISGENGIYIRNQIYYTTRFNKRNLRLLNGFRFYVGGDYGFVDNSVNKGSNEYLDREELFSVSVGVKKSFRYGSFEVTYAKPINGPRYIDKGDGSIYLFSSIYF